MPLADILKSIDEQKQLADLLRPIAPERLKVLNQKLRLDWNYNSNALEGNTLTLSETRMLLLHGYHTGNKLGRHYEEVKLHDDVLGTLEELVRRNEPMTEVLIRSLHHQLMGDEYFVSAYDSFNNVVNVKGKPGQYKDKTNGIKRIVNGKEIFIPFKTPDEVRIEMPELIQWYRSKEEKAEIHPVMLAAIFHFRFVTLHPFDDGNGRMSRILMNMILMRAGYTPAIIRIDERAQYNANLALAQDGGNIEPFIELVANDTLRSIELLVKAAKGENIEEKDDLDKEIELLKRNVKQDDNISVNISNKDYQPIWKKSIYDLITHIDEKTSKFNELFERQISSFATKNLQDFPLAYIATELNHLLTEDTIKIKHQFLTYKTNVSNSFDLSVSIEIKLHKNKYIITYSNETGNTINHEYFYSQVIEKETIDKIANDLAKVILKEIKQKTKET